jgi:K(+)-stimulated pyrophosphate-energized sodium pump
MVLLVAYLEQVRASLLTTGQKTIQLVSGRIVDVSTADILDFVDYYQINVMNIKFLFGVFIGAMVVLVFSGLVFRSVGGVANRLVEEIRRQFANSGIMQGIVSPDYDRCILVTTKGAQKGMILPSLLGLIVPALVGLLFGVAGIMGLLLSAMAIGFPLAIFMGNAGGAWDNAKKYIEMGHFGGKGSDAHKAAVVGDTVGDPCKDTVGPSLDILIKLMSIVSIVLVGLHI